MTSYGQCSLQLTPPLLLAWTAGFEQWRRRGETCSGRKGLNWGTRSLRGSSKCGMRGNRTNCLFPFQVYQSAATQYGGLPRNSTRFMNNDTGIMTGKMQLKLSTCESIAEE